jgi:hypothetical protein
MFFLIPLWGINFCAYLVYFVMSEVRQNVNRDLSIGCTFDCKKNFVQLRQIDENRATLKRAKDLAKKSQSAKGSFYISSNSSSSSSLDYEIPIGLKDDLSRYFVSSVGGLKKFQVKVSCTHSS